MARSVRRKSTRDNAKTGKTMNKVEMMIFGFIIIYVIFFVLQYFKSEPIRAYEVTMGSLSISKNYTGIALREETIINSPYNGYINYFVREKERVSTRDQVYSIDESGHLAEILRKQDSSNTTYSNEELADFKSDIINYDRNFDQKDFYSVYDFKYELQGDIVQLVNLSMYEGLDEMNKSSLGGMVNLCTTNLSGYVVFNTDGYEGMTIDDINVESFDVSEYEAKRKRISNNDLIEANSPIGKVVTNENWSLVIQVDEERAEALEKAGNIKVKFVKNQESSWASVSIYRKANDLILAKLDFNNSCNTFCNERFVEIELIINDEQGLKIPNTAIVEKEFFIIPAQYIKRGGKNNNYGVNKEFFDENGNVITQFVETTVYNSDENEYYVDNTNLKIGDYLCADDTMDRYPVSKSGVLIGVYNMNKGYADFKQITIMYSNEEYSIVSSNTKYGLTVYDRIVLDASSVNNDDFTYHSKKNESNKNQ